MFPGCRIEVRQVGPRDAAKAISGIGSCGIEKRCCSRFLTEFSSISIKMAKSQDISLTPMEITGICGRLRCCLVYEHEMYEEARAKLPKKKKMVVTPLGEGKVLQVLALRDSVIVELPEKGPREFTRTELETGVLEEKVPSVVLKEFEFTEEDEGVEVVRLESPRSRGEKSRERRGPRRDKAQQTNTAQPQKSRSNQRSNREQKPTSERKQAQNSRSNQPQRNAGQQKPRDTQSQAQSQRKSRPGYRRKSRTQRDQAPQTPQTPPTQE